MENNRTYAEESKAKDFIRYSQITNKTRDFEFFRKEMSQWSGTPTGPKYAMLKLNISGRYQQGNGKTTPRQRAEQQLCALLNGIPARQAFGPDERLSYIRQLFDRALRQEMRSLR